MKLFFIALLLSSLSTFAGCEDVNLYDDNKSPLNSIPIYDQGPDGSCYAYAGAQLYDYHKIQDNPKATGELTSALWLGLSHKLKNLKYKWYQNIHRHISTGANPKGIGYSNIKYALTDFQNIGHCPQELIDKRFQELFGEIKISKDEVLYLADLVVHNFVDIMTQNQNMSFQQGYDKAYEKSVKELSEEYKSDEKYSGHKCEQLERVPKVLATVKSIQGFKKILSYTLLSDKKINLKNFKDYFFKYCTEKEITKLHKYKIDDFANGNISNKRLIKKMNKILDNKKPFAIGHCSSVFKSKPGQFDVDLSKFGVTSILGQKRSGKLANKKIRSKCSAHYALVVAKRKKQNSCEYLVRNSYGEKLWSKYHDCYCEEKIGSKVIKRDCNFANDSEKKLKVLGCWINSNDLAKVTFQVTSLKK